MTRAKPVRRCPWFRCPNKKGGKRAAAVAEHFPFCCAECKAAAELAEHDRIEWPKRLARRRAAERLAGARGMRQAELVRFAEDCEHEQISLPSPAEIDAEVEAAWKTLRAHSGCHGHFFEYGRAAYQGCAGEDRCEVCGETLTCGGEAKPHRWGEMTVEAARAAGVMHFVNCYHVYRCCDCGEIKSVDSSG